MNAKCGLSKKVVFQARGIPKEKQSMSSRISNFIKSYSIVVHKGDDCR